MTEFRELGIIRDPQPNDVVVITVPIPTAAETCARIGEVTKAELGCRVIVVSDGIRVGDDGAAVELAALKAHRCDGCLWAADRREFGIRCKRWSFWTRADHACNAWTAKEPTT